MKKRLPPPPLGVWYQPDLFSGGDLPPDLVMLSVSTPLAAPSEDGPLPPLPPGAAEWSPLDPSPDFAPLAAARPPQGRRCRASG